MTPEPLVLGDLTATFWGGNKLNAPEVQLEIDTHRIDYDRDYNTEEKIVGGADLPLEDARRLHAFLGEVLGEEDYEYSVSHRHTSTGIQTTIDEESWNTKQEISDYMDEMLTTWLINGLESKMVRRRKAGPVEDVDA